MTIRVTINGSDVELPETLSVFKYLESKGLAERRIAVAHNGDLLPRERFRETMISEGDILEIVRPVGGG